MLILSESEDYRRLVVNVGSTNRRTYWELNLIDDNLSLELVEQLSLNYEADRSFQFLIILAQNTGEFIRDSVIVNITDNDGKTAELLLCIFIYVFMLKVI